MDKPVIAIAMGDPAGVGPEIVAKALAQEMTYARCCPVVVGDVAVMERASRAAGVALRFRQIGDLAEAILRAIPADQYPYLREFTADHALQPGYHFGNSFEVGLDLLLDAIGTAATLGPAR